MYIVIMPLGLDRFTKIPNTKTWLIRQQESQSYQIVNKDDQLEYYDVTSLTATTNSHYLIKRKDKLIAEVEQDRIQNKYNFIFDGEIKASVKLDKNQIELEYEPKLHCTPKLRAKEFVFQDTETNDIVLTIDKKSLSILKDKYQLVHQDSFNEIIAMLLVIIIDDSYHSGLLA